MGILGGAGDRDKMTSMNDAHGAACSAGEDAALAAIRQVIDPHNASRPGLIRGPGDDAAVLRCVSGQSIITTDTLSEGQDFRREWWKSASEAEWAMDVGTKAAAQNLSDLNAMGAAPRALLVSLTVPPNVSLDWIRCFYRGILRACSQPGAEQCVVAGGDLGAGHVISVTITAVGEPDESGRLLTRAGARPGDSLALSGRLGFAAAGLALLERPDARVPEPCAGWAGQGTAAQCLAAQKRPEPPLTAGAAALSAGATAGMDLSDGLLRDAGRMAQASGVQIHFDDQVLTAEARNLEAVARDHLGYPASATQDWVLTGGEDYGLLATFPPDVTLPEGFRRLGWVTSGPPGLSTELRGAHEGWDSLSP